MRHREAFGGDYEGSANTNTYPFGSRISNAVSRDGWVEMGDLIDYRPTLMRIEPLREEIRSGGPPLPTEPLTARFVTVPLTVAPVTCTEPDPLVASSVRGGLATATSTALEPVDIAHWPSGWPSTVIRPLRVVAASAPRTPRS